VGTTDEQETNQGEECHYLNAHDMGDVARKPELSGGGQPGNELTET
jgi:hypothetical protein